MHKTRKSLIHRLHIDPTDSQAWTEFDALYRPLLKRIARQCGLTDTEADDVAQQCIVSFMGHVKTFNYDPSKGKFRGYLKRIVKNQIAKTKRKKRPLEAESQDFRRPQQREQDPEAHFDTVWTNEHLEHCLKQIRKNIKESTYQSFVKYVLEERPIEEVCSELGVIPDQVHKAKWRIMRMLKERFRRICDDDEP